MPKKGFTVQEDEQVPEWETPSPNFLHTPVTRSRKTLGADQ